MSADQELLGEFLLESRDILNALDRDFVELEKDPADQKRLQAIFRAIHTMKGTSGFIPLPKLEALAHAGESLLSRLRDGELHAKPAIISVLLAMVDAIRDMVGEVEATGSDGENPYSELVARLIALAQAPSEPKPASGEVVAAPSGPAAPAPTVPSPPPSAPEAVAAHPAPPPPAPSAPGDGEHKASLSDTTIRVDVGLLDRVMNLVGELVLARNQIIQYGQTVKDAGFSDASARLNLLTTELHEGVMKTRMQPIGNVWTKFPRVVRDLALACGKKIALELDGNETELDRTIIEAIKDPLTHAVRNAVDHGIELPAQRRAAGKPEEGRLTLRAYHEGGQVNLEISDDGAGIDLQRVKELAIERGLITADRAERMSEREIVHLIFAPGFSTASKVTNVSGRGVGMDVVKTNVEKLGGTVDVQTRRGEGTRLKIKLPLTLAIVPALIVRTCNERFAIPQVNLLELVRLEGDRAKHAIEKVHGTSVYRLRGNLLPLVWLDKTLELPQKQGEAEAINIVVLQADDRMFGLVVDEVHDTEEIVVKPLGRALKGINAFAGATIMGDGSVALILDVPGIASRANVASAAGKEAPSARLAPSARSADQPETLLLFQVGEKFRLALPLSRVARLEEIERSKIEHASGRRVVQYRDQILPLIELSALLGGAAAKLVDGPLQVIVFSENGRSVGLVVDQILDVVEQVVQARSNSSHPLLAGSAVVHGKVTDLLDVHAAVRRAEPQFFSARAA